MQFRLRAAGLHLAASAAVAAFAWWLVFRVWYPPPFSALAGGAGLFVLLVSVDVVLGPALTAVVASPRKRRPEWLRDLAVIVAVQSAAFAYGLYTVAAARPVVIAFEVDLFRVLSLAEVDGESLPLAPPALRTMSWTGPVLLAATKPVDPAEQLRSIELGLAGVPLAALPAYWREYGPHAARAWAAAKPLASWLAVQPAGKPEVERLAAATGQPLAGLRTLPLLARRAEGTVLLAPGGQVLGYLSAPYRP